MSHHEKHDEHPNVTLFKEMEARMQTEGPLAMGDYLADDVEWHEIGGSEPIRGKAALAERFAGMVDLGELKVDTHATVADDEHVVQLVTATVTKNDGSQLVYRTAEIYHVKDGKVTARWAFSDDTDRINKFFAGT
jgi:ketosteroid isomerase-like protein